MPVGDRPRIYAQRVHEPTSGQWIPHSSAGGEQPKFTASVVDATGNVRQVLVKFSPPEGETTPAAQRWRDLLRAEFHALSLLARDGLASFGAQAAATELLRGTDGRWYLESTRFDRMGGLGRAPVFSLRTLLIEAKGTLPRWAAAARVLHEHGCIDEDTLTRIRFLDAYGHFLGNTDRHSGNLAFQPGLPGGSSNFVVAPAYDFLPMQYAPDSQGSVVPGFQGIPDYTEAEGDEVALAKTAATLFWQEIARDSEMSDDFRKLACQHADAL